MEWDISPDIHGNAPVEKNGVAVGSYPIDLHFCQPGIGDIYKPVAPYQIPYEVLVPEKIDGFLAGTGRNISVSRIVNGTTRLQQVESYIGQAAGIAASLAVRENKHPRDLDVRQIQDRILAQNGRIIFVRDFPPENAYFPEVQKLLAQGVLVRGSDSSFSLGEYAQNFQADQFLARYDTGSGSVASIPGVSRGYFVSRLRRFGRDLEGLVALKDAGLD
jgi:hypothetical protein